MEEEISTPIPPEQQLPAYYSQQNAEFLKYLLESQQQIDELIYELEGKEVAIVDKKPVLVQARPPIINNTLRNSIVSVFKTYATSKIFSSTTLDNKQIGLIVYKTAHQVIDLLEKCETYSGTDWANDSQYKQNYPAFMVGSQQQILNLVEDTVLAAINRSKDALTLNKVTGMHHSVETRNTGDGKRAGLFSGWFGGNNNMQK